MIVIQSCLMYLTNTDGILNYSITIPITSLLLIITIKWLRSYDKIIEELGCALEGSSISKSLWENFDKKHWVNKLLKPYYSCLNNNKIESYTTKYPRSSISKIYINSKIELDNYKSQIEEQSKLREEEAIHLRIIEEISNSVRSNQTNLNEIADSILADICKKTSSQYGILYFYNNKEETLNSSATYAIDRLKQSLDTKIKGEGIVGQTIIEKRAIHFKEVPLNYIKITSGLGEVDPKELYISPILYNDEIVGAIELGSMYSYESKRITLIEQILKIIASAIKDTQNTKSNAQLLRAAQEASQTMREQEEELKQNAEELQANHEELERKLNIQMKCIKQLQREEDNVIVNIAGRNRMLSQQIAFYCELLYNDKTSNNKLEKAIDLHHHTLFTLKNGGIPKGVEYNSPLPPANKEIILAIQNIETLWIPYKQAAEKIIANGSSAKEEIQFIEENTDELLKRNNQLVSIYMVNSDKWRKNVFEELSNVIKMAS